MTYEDALKAMRFFKEKLCNGIYNQHIGAFNVVMKAIEKQIPKEPRLYTDTIQGIDCSIEQDVYLCPTCDEFCCFMNENEQQFNHCHNCGQAIDWSDV